MNKILDFLLQHWKEILWAVLMLVSFTISLILAIRKRGKENILTSVKEALLEQIPTWAILSEGFSSGQAKKENVLTLGLALVQKMLGRNLSADENAFWVSFLTEQLEKILSTPQKKLTVVKKENVSKYRIGG